MLISGIQQFTLLDYPDKTACIVFMPGCNFRCGYCHNPEFVLPERIAQLRSTFIPETALFNFLNERKDILDGVVITGGEPTLMPDLIEFMGKIKSLGFLVKLDTNGTHPGIIAHALENGVVDYVAMDVKTNLSEYAKLVGQQVVPERIAQSIEVLKQSNMPHEFRLTLIQEIHPPRVLKEIAAMLRSAQKVFLQTFRPGTTLNPIFANYHSFSDEQMHRIAILFRTTAKEVAIR